MQTAEGGEVNSVHSSALSRILVVDDDEAILELVRQALSPFYFIVTASDSLLAVDLLINERFDLLIIDLGLPLLDGTELIRQLRSQPPYAQIPILVMSAFPKLRDRLSGSEVEAILPKPFAVDQLARVVADTLARPRTTDPPGPTPASDA